MNFNGAVSLPDLLLSWWGRFGFRMPEMSPSGAWAAQPPQAGQATRNAAALAAERQAKEAAQVRRGEGFVPAGANCRTPQRPLLRLGRLWGASALAEPSLCRACKSAPSPMPWLVVAHKDICD